MLESLKNKFVLALLKSLVSKYFNDLKIKGYELSVKLEKETYIINAQLPKTSIDSLINKIKK